MVKTLMKQIKEYKKDSLLTMLFATLEVVLEIMIPLLMASLIDKGIEAGNMSNVTKYGALMFVIALGTLSLGFLAGNHAAKASTGFGGHFMNKKELRAKIKAKKSALTEQQIVDCSSRLAQQLFRHPAYQAAKSIYGYLSFNEEVRTVPILRQAQLDGKRVAVPKVFGDTMRFLWLDDLDAATQLRLLPALAISIVVYGLGLLLTFRKAAALYEKVDL